MSRAIFDEVKERSRFYRICAAGRTICAVSGSSAIGIWDSSVRHMALVATKHGRVRSVGQEQTTQGRLGLRRGKREHAR